MSSEQIYCLLLSKPKEVSGRTMHGFSYQVKFDNGCVEIEEHGHPTKIILWDKDGPELADLTEQMVKERIEEILS